MATPDVPGEFDFVGDQSPLSVHRAGLGGFFRYNVGPVGLAAISLLLGLGALAIYFTREAATLTPGLILSLLAVPLIVWAVARYAKPVREVHLYPDGVVWLEEGRWRGYRWDDIEEVYRTEVRVNGVWQTRQVYLKPRQEGGAALTHAVDAWPKMADTIQMEVHKRQLPAARAAFEAGEPVDFGPVVMNRRGLTVEGADLPWEEIKDVRVGNGAIAFLTDKRGNGKYAALGQIPNYLTLLKLLEQAPVGSPRLRG